MSTFKPLPEISRDDLVITDEPMCTQPGCDGYGNIRTERGCGPCPLCSAKDIGKQIAGSLGRRFENIRLSDFPNPHLKAIAEDYSVVGGGYDKRQCLIILGKQGTGKTSVIAAMIRKFLETRENFRFEYVAWGDFCQAYMATEFVDKYAMTLVLRTAPFLILEDYGRHVHYQNSDILDDLWAQIIRDRHALVLRTVITSNLRREDFFNSMQSWIASRLEDKDWSRIETSGTVKDFRRP